MIFECKNKSNKGFTLIELMVIIVIVGILSLVGQIVFKSYTKQAVLTEGRSLMSTILTAQKNYYVEYSNVYKRTSTWNDWTIEDVVLDIDASSCKYFTAFTVSNKDEGSSTEFVAYAPIPQKAYKDGKTMLRMGFNMKKGYVTVSDPEYLQIG